MSVREAEGFGCFAVLEVLKITELDAEGVLFGHRILGLSGWALCGELLFKNHHPSFEIRDAVEGFGEHFNGDFSN